MLKRVLAGINRTRISSQATRRVRLPITAQVLARIHSTLVTSSRSDQILIWAIASMAFFGFFRLGELLVESPTKYNPATCLSWGDVALDSRDTPSMIRIHLRQSKCDQLGKGVDVIVGRTDTPICPVKAILAYICLRQDSPGAFFVTQEHTPVTKPWFVAQIREILTAIGLPQEDYAGHSFRIGAATTAALAGVEDSTIQVLGRWQSTAFLQYIRLPGERLASISRVLASSVGTPDPARDS